MALAVAGNALNAMLLTSAAVEAIVGNRIYPDEMPQGESLPAVVYTEESVAVVRKLAGNSGTAHPRYQVDCLAATRKEARTLAAAVRSRIEDFNSQAIGGVWVQWVIVEDAQESTASITNKDGTARLVKSKTLDVVIWHNVTPES